MDKKNTVTKQIPDLSLRILTRHTKLEYFDRVFNYRSIVGNLNYLEKGVHSNISYIVHQCEIFFTCPKREHGAYVKNIVSYLIGISINCTILRLCKEKLLEVFYDVYFAGNCNPKETEDRDI